MITFMYSFSTSNLRDVIFSMKAAGDNPKSSQQVATASKDAFIVVVGKGVTDRDRVSVGLQK